MTITWFILLDLPIVFIIILHNAFAPLVSTHHVPKGKLIELCSWKIVRISEQVMPTYKHPIIFSPPVEAIVHILLFHSEERYHESKDLA